MFDRRRWTATPVIAAVLSLFTGASASAQTYTVSGGGVKMGNWAFAPIVKHENGQERLDSFLALVDTNTVTGNVITAVWYQRGATDDSAWTAKSWYTSWQWEAIKSVKDSLQIGDEYDALWPTNQSEPGQPYGNPEPPKDYKDGLIVGDPIAVPLALSPDRDIIITFLVDIGYKAADITLEKLAVNAECEQKNMLTGMAKSVEAMDAGASGTAAVAAYTAYVQTKCALFCFPGTWRTPYAPVPGPSGAFTGSWVLTGQTNGTSGIPTMCNYTYEACRTVSWTETHLGWDCSVTVTPFTGTQCWAVTTCSCSGTGAATCPPGPTCCGTPALPTYVPPATTPTDVTPTAPVGPTRRRIPFTPNPIPGLDR